MSPSLHYEFVLKDMLTLLSWGRSSRSAVFFFGGVLEMWVRVQICHTIQDQL